MRYGLGAVRDGVLSYVSGSEIVAPFLIKAQETIADLTGGHVSAEVWWAGAKRITLTEGAGVEILDVAPPPAPTPASQQPHGIARLSEAQGLTITDGPGCTDEPFIRFIFVSADGVTMQTAGTILRRIR